MLAGYRLEGLLGRGGMSVVYLAEDLRLKRKVALKLLEHGLGENESVRSQFLRESELAASIDHPHIVPIYEAGESTGRLSIAMRYVEGGDLKRRLRDGPLEPAVAARIIAQVASALMPPMGAVSSTATSSPRTCCSTSAPVQMALDHAYLADFGLTERRSERSRPGDDDPLTGTVDYVAPEQIVGDEVDGRADAYSLACVLFECLTGQPPFRRESDVAVVFAHLHEEPPALRASRPELPSALDAAIARTLAKQPDQRSPSCGALAQVALAATLDDAARGVADAAARAASGRSDLSEIEAELADRVLRARDQARNRTDTSRRTAGALQGAPPYKGLTSFGHDDADLFFGRERLVAELVARLAGSSSFLALVGPSGSGKSSVLHAGVLAALDEGVLPTSAHWPRRTLRPGEHPLAGPPTRVRPARSGPHRRGARPARGR